MLGGLKLFCLLWQQHALYIWRAPNFGQNAVALTFRLIGGCVFVFYLLLCSVELASLSLVEQEPALIIGILPFVLTFDFFIRLMTQQTPTIRMLSCILLPVKRKSVIASVLFIYVLGAYNCLWLFFFVPYVFIIVSGGSSLLIGIIVLCVGVLGVVSNSLLTLLFRILAERNVVWTIAPVVFYGAFFFTWMIVPDGHLFLRQLDFTMEMLSHYWAPIVLLLFVVILFVGIQEFYEIYIYKEIESRGEQHHSQLLFIDRILGHMGYIGEYLKLEIVSLVRNKAVRSRFILCSVMVVGFSLLVGYTDLYEGFHAVNFWCYYCFLLYGIFLLVRIMGVEGNYMDVLMTHRNTILPLLHAKYYLCCLLLLIPLTILLPAVDDDRSISIPMLLSHFFMAGGISYPIFFTLAIFNRQTISLQQQLTGRMKTESGPQLILEFVGMLLPYGLFQVFHFLFEASTAYLLIIGTGAALMLAHPLWLRLIYKYVMQNKHINIEEFRASS